MNHWIRKLHIYAGLLNFSILTVFGIVGLTVTLDALRILHEAHAPRVEVQSFHYPVSMSDKEIGHLIEQKLRPPHAGPPDIRRDPATHQLVVTFYTVNGITRATALEQTNQLRVEASRTSIWEFFNNAHAMTIAGENSDVSVRAWSWYIEFAIWSLIFMALSGAWLGLTERQRFRWTNVSLGAGCAVFAAFYFLTK